MKAKKNWIAGFVVVCLCVVIATVFAKAPTQTGTEWEYAHYKTSVHAKITKPIGITARWLWRTSTEKLEEEEEVKTMWRKAGFDFGNKKVEEVDWFDFLGGKGWELISVNRHKSDYGTEVIVTEGSFWFKRPKRL